MRGYRRGSTPASTVPESRCRSRTFAPSSIFPTRLRTASVVASVEPLRRNLTFSSASRAMSRRLISPALYAARPNWNELEPAISVRSRSKNAAPFSPGLLSAPPPGGGGRMCGRSVNSDVNDDGVALAAAGADRHAAIAAAAAAQLEHDRAEDARAGRADRMPERDRAAVDVHAPLVDVEHADAVERDRGERLVDLPQVDVGWLQPGLVERLQRRVGGRAREVGELVGDLRLGDDRAEDVLAVALGPVLGGEDQRAGAVVDAGRVAGRVAAVLAAEPRELRERLEAAVAPRRLVDLDDRVSLATAD